MTDINLPAFLPEPKRVRFGSGVFRPPARGIVAVRDASLYGAAQAFRTCFPAWDLAADAPPLRAQISLRLRQGLEAEQYRLAVGPRGIAVEAGSPAGAMHAARTFGQLAAQCQPGALPVIVIDDRPDFPQRGVYLDLSRGRVPTLESLKRVASELARYKVNQIQIYVEHTFRFRGHPDIGRNASPLTPGDVLALDAHCRGLGIELVPSLATFGHMGNVLVLPRYRRLAEDWGEGRYVDPLAEDRPAWQKRRGWTLSPANPGSYAFLDSLFAEFLPLFSSPRFNICCDETWDLGLGQTCALCRRRGKGRVYLDHILRVAELAAKRGKRVMFWGDIIRGHPELIPEIPGDITVLDWGYSHDHPFDRVRDFRRAGVPFIACPGTSSWVSLFPRLHEAAANIAGFARAAKRWGGVGLLNTDWGDGGHYNFTDCSWHGFLFGAEQGWNTVADTSDFTRRFCSLFLRSGRADLPAAVDRLGDVAHLSVSGYYQSVWQTVFFAPVGHPLFASGRVMASTSRRGAIRRGEIGFNAALGSATLEQLAPVKEALAAAAREQGADPQGALPYWRFAVDTLGHAARKLAALGPGGRDTPAARRELVREMRSLMRRFEALWMARNRRSEIRITLARYRKAIRSLLG